MKTHHTIRTPKQRKHLRALKHAKLHKLAASEGWEPKDTELFLASVMFDSIQPGICMVAGCDYTTEVEPDQRHGYCENCRSNTVRSVSEIL